MAFLHRDFYKAHIVYFLVVGKGFEYVRFFVNHPHLFGHPWQKRSLNRQREQDDTEHQIKQIILSRYSLHNCKDSKYDGSHSSQPCPGYQTDLSQSGFEGKQNTKHRYWTCNQCHEQHNQQRWQNYLRQLCRCNQQTKQKENHHLADTGNHIEKVYQIPFSRKIGVSHQNTAQVNAQISISPEQSRQSVSKGCNGKHQDSFPLLQFDGKVV